MHLTKNKIKIALVKQTLNDVITFLYSLYEKCFPNYKRFSGRTKNNFPQKLFVICSPGEE